MDGDCGDSIDDDDELGFSSIHTSIRYPNKTKAFMGI